MATPLRVLILEDKPSDAEVLVTKLRQAGFLPDWHRVETEAEYLAALDRPPDIILAEYILPRYNAIDALQRLRERGLEIPFIVISGTLDDAAAVNSLKSGADDYLLKDGLARLGLSAEKALEARRILEEKHKAEEAARKNQERLDMAITGSGVYVWDWDLESGKVNFIDNRFGEAFGYAPEEIRPEMRWWRKLAHPDDLPRATEAFARHMEGKAPFMEAEYRVRTKAGEWRWLLTRGRVVERDRAGMPLRAAGTHLDITDRKKAAEELDAAYKRLAFHIRHMPLGYIVWDREFRVMEWNPAAKRIFGWTEAEALGKHPYDLIVPPQAQPPIDKVWENLLAGDEMNHSVNANVRRDGREITCEWFNASLRGVDGRVNAVLSIVHDVTEKIRLEKQLQAAQKMETVGTLAGGIAHDFNNSLTGILGFSQMLRMRLSGDPKASSDIDEIMRCAERAATLTKQLLTFARRQIIEPVNLDLNAAVTGLMKLVGKMAGENVEVKAVLAGGVPIVRADRAQVEQVLMNLCLNARDAMPQGGTLMVGTKEATVEASDLDRYPYAKPGRYAVLEVSDTGVGMDKKTRDRVFDPFFTTKGPDRGTGLGLAVVYGIVKQHDGFINVYSEPGKGTSFSVYFPAVLAIPDSAEERKEEPLRGGTETVLVAEDEGMVRTLAERILGEYGYRVVSAANGEEAIEAFRRNSDVSIAVLDVIMPVKGGREAYEVMRRERQGLKVIFTSGYSAEAIHESYRLEPGLQFLPKPYSPTMLARVVREVLDS